MPYIYTEEVRAIRKALKDKLPDWKLSVSKSSNHSSVTVAIMAGPIDFTDYMLFPPKYGHWPTDQEVEDQKATLRLKPYLQINHYYLDTNWEGEALELLNTIKATILETKPVRTIVEDADYGSIPNYYYHIHLGKWNKPYKRRP